MMIQVDPKSNDECSYGHKEKRHIEKRRRQSKEGAEIRVIYPQAQECKQSPEAGKGKEQNLP